MAMLSSLGVVDRNLDRTDRHKKASSTMVCLPCCIYPVMAFLIAMYYRYMHPVVEPILSKIWRDKIEGQSKDSKESSKSSTQEDKKDD